MKVGILDIDTKREKMGHGKHEKFPNLAAGKIFGYHKMQRDEVIWPWNGERVDRLYVSTIFSWTRQTVERLLPEWQKYADEVIVGGTGYDYTVKLPPRNRQSGSPLDVRHVRHPIWDRLYDSRVPRRLRLLCRLAQRRTA